MRPDSGQVSLVNAVANQMASDSPAKALDWADQLQDGPGRNQAVNSVISKWASTDPARRAVSSIDVERTGATGRGCFAGGDLGQ